jgi:hypothetical protein
LIIVPVLRDFILGRIACVIFPYQQLKVRGYTLMRPVTLVSIIT